MRKRFRLLAAPAAAICACGAFVLAARAETPRLAPAKAPAIRVMDWNVRYSAGDRKSPHNNWENRRDDFARAIERESPDLIAFQEVLPDQRKFLEERFAAYDFTGEGRNADRKSGESSPVAWRRDRFTLIDCGSFWLSETPDVPGSRAGAPCSPESARTPSSGTKPPASASHSPTPTPATRASSPAKRACSSSSNA
ncbi:MAG: endonuclease/exonuclease/phosphatase family protein [Kiritimatiellae bacterium]|nr:endonuclease/exonuclease/phosphatase family protein [Kiritimatiellia bacterium]